VKTFLVSQQTLTVLWLNNLAISDVIAKNVSNAMGNSLSYSRKEKISLKALWDSKP
jgi:hypothetical protein